MKNKSYLYLTICLILLLSAGLIYAKIMPDTDGDGLSDQEETTVYGTNPLSQDTDLDGYFDWLEIHSGYSPTKAYAARLLNVSLDLPYINESPDGSWTGPWKNACEEASIAMAENYYLGRNQVGVKDAMSFMNFLFKKEDQIWGSNSDTDALRTAKLINDYTVYNGTIIDNPTIEQIKKELQQKRPVISLHYGKTLNNPNIPFLATGSYYHMMIIIGYDDTTEEFITHDTGDIKTGTKHRYKYELFMESLHDFDFTSRKANGPARVIFTYPKLAKITGSPKVYYLTNDEIKHWITDEKTFNAKGWNWDAINVVSEAWVNTFQAGPDVKI